MEHMAILPVKLRVKDQNYRQPKSKLSPQWPFRIALIGRSGSGKTNLMFNLLRQTVYDDLTVIARTLDNTQYQSLMQVVDEAEQKIGHPVAIFSEKLEDLPPVKDYSPSLQHLVLFDDLISLPESQLQPIIPFFTQGRHQNISCILCSQSYHKIPKTIRLQCNYVVVFGGLNEDDTRDVWGDFVSHLTWREFQEVYKSATQEKYSFLVIDENNPTMHLRKGWNQVWATDDNSDD